MRKLLKDMPPVPLFFIGLITLPAFLFQDRTLLRITEAGLFLVLCVLSGKRVRILPGFVLILSVTAASLLVPYGAVLVRVFGFPVTAGALEFGLSRGFLLLGLFYLSKFSVSSGLRFPGSFGKGIGKVFYYFERFSESRERILIRDLPGSLDAVLISVSKSPGYSRTMEPEKRSAPYIPVVPLAASVFCWALLFV